MFAHEYRSPHDGAWYPCLIHQPEDAPGTGRHTVTVFPANSGPYTISGVREGTGPNEWRVKP